MTLQTTADQASQTLKNIITSITTNLEPVVDTVIDESLQSITINISAPENQLGQIIGKEGKIIKSLRTLLNIAYPNIRLNLQIKD